MPRWRNTGPEPQGPMPGSPQPSGLAGHWPAQREVEGLTELFPRVIHADQKPGNFPAGFLCHSTLPSLMNGGKDFSPWSKRDTLLYRTLRLPVEAALGKDGVGWRTAL